MNAYWVLAVLVLPPALWLARLPSPSAPVMTLTERDDSVNACLIGLVTIFFFCIVGANFSVSAWIFTYATRLGVANATTATGLTAAFWGALTGGRLLAIPLAMYVSPRTMLITDVLGIGVSVGAALLWPHAAVVLWMSVIGMGLAMASVFPTMLAFAERQLHMTGQITSFFFIGGSLAGMALPWLIGQLFEPLGPPVVLLVVLSAVSMLGIVLMVLMRMASKT